MLYGNATATPQMERAATWDASYTAVWHLGDGVGSDAVVDSTGAARHGVKDSNLLTPAMGAMGSGFSFGGTIADHFSIPTTGLPTGMFTLEAWLNVSVASGGTSRLLSTPTSFQSRYGVEYTGPYVGGGGSGDFTVDPAVTGDTSFTKNFIFPPNMWVHAMITWNSSVGGTEVYLNGFTGGTSTAIPSPPVRPDPGAMYFGGAPVIDKPGPLGTVDEVRLSTTVRSPAYAKAAYEIGRPGSTMVTLGPAQAAF